MKFFTLYQSQKIYFPDKETAIQACDELGLRFFFTSADIVDKCYWKEDDGEWVEKTEAEMHRGKNFI